jgi:prepilin-type N-terminal cleavage/methylation domain-containing protein
MRRPSPAAGQAGFTLLEIIIALGIMAGAFIGIYGAQTQSVSNSSKIRQLNTAAMLAKQKMVETELLMQGKAFTEVDKEESGTFPSPHQDYAWSRVVKEIKFPPMGGGAAAGAAGAGSAGNGGAPGADQAGEMMGKLVTNFLSKAVREITVTVSWARGKGRMEQSVTTYWVDLNHEFSLSE